MVKNNYDGEAGAGAEQRNVLNNDLVNGNLKQVDSQYSDLKPMDEDQHNFSIVPESSHKIDVNQQEYVNFDIESRKARRVSAKSSQIENVDHRVNSRNQNNSEVNLTADNIGPYNTEMAPDNKFPSKGRNSLQQ